MNHLIYIHKNKVNGKVYVGQTVNTSKRWGKNGIGYKANPIFYKAIEKYGWDNFEHIIVKDGLTQEEANELEIDTIYALRSFIGFSDCNGYNATLGGDGKSKYETDEERREGFKKSQSKYLNRKFAKRIANKKARMRKNANKKVFEKQEIKWNFRIGQFTPSGMPLKMWENTKLAAKELGLTEGGVLHICNNNTWKLMRGEKLDSDFIICLKYWKLVV